MSTIAALRIPADDTVLSTTCEYVPGLVCELEQVVVSDRFGLWLSGADWETVETALGADPTVGRFRHLSSDGGRHLFAVTFTGRGSNPLDVVAAEGGSVLAASVEDGIWTLRIRVLERSRVSEIYDRINGEGPPVDVVRLQALTQASAESAGLTDEQYHAISEAIEHGYFEIPRRMSLEELAAELGISHQALSERLRRAYQTLAAQELENTEGDRIARIETDA